MNEIPGILKAEMARDGAISFERFMELALYCPNFGYYERPDVSPGRKGDFFTSVSVGNLFGELLANQFADWSAECGMRSAESGNAECEMLNATWQIVEAGAHDGRLAADVLQWLRTEREEIFGTLEYWILEPSARRREAQAKTISEYTGKVKWFASWDEIPATGVNGVIFSNELLDAMPVRRIGWDAANKKWFEWGVTWNGTNFIWTKLDDSAHSALRTPHSALPLLPPELLAVLPDGFTTEICPAAENWWRGAARSLKSGKLLTIDYGLKAEQFFAPGRKNGTLRAYHRHHQSSDLLANPGEQDLTAQVNFSAIQAAGESEGLTTDSFTTQRQFLTAIIEKNCCHNPTIKEWTSFRVRQFQTLTHPEHLGQLFQVLVQGRAAKVD